MLLKARQACIPRASFVLKEVKSDRNDHSRDILSDARRQTAWTLDPFEAVQAS